MVRQGRVTVSRHVSDDDVSPPAYEAALAQPAVAQSAFAQPTVVRPAPAQPPAALAPQPSRPDSWPYADTRTSPGHPENPTALETGQQQTGLDKFVPAKQSWLHRCGEVLLDIGTGIACFLACVVLVPLALVANVVVAVVASLAGIICRPFLMCYWCCAD